MSSGDELDSRWVDGVVWGAAKQEEEEATLVWCVERPCDQGMDLGHVLRIRDYKHPRWRFLVDGHDIPLYPQDALLGSLFVVPVRAESWVPGSGVDLR